MFPGMHAVNHIGIYNADLKGLSNLCDTLKSCWTNDIPEDIVSQNFMERRMSETFQKLKFSRLIIKITDIRKGFV